MSPEFRAHERTAAMTRVYRCCECGFVSTTGGLDMSPIDTEVDICDDERACNRRIDYSLPPDDGEWASDRDCR